MNKSLKLVAIAALFSTNFAFAQQSNLDSEIDCKQEQNSMLGMKYCAGKEEAATAKTLTQKQRAIRKNLDKDSRVQFDRFTKAAAKYKEELCAYEGEGSKGGSIYGMVITGCHMNENQRQIKMLDEMTNRPEGTM